MQNTTSVRGLFGNEISHLGPDQIVALSLNSGERLVIRPHLVPLYIMTRLVCRKPPWKPRANATCGVWNNLSSIERLRHLWSTRSDETCFLCCPRSYGERLWRCFCVIDCLPPGRAKPTSTTGGLIGRPTCLIRLGANYGSPHRP